MSIFTNFSGATITLIGGIISVLGVLVGLYGAYKSSNQDGDWQTNMDKKTTTILDSGSDRSTADSLLLNIREESLKRELNRSFKDLDVDQLLENSKNIEQTSTDLEVIKLQKQTNDHAEFVKFLRPVLFVIIEQSKNIINSLESKGIVIEKKYPASLEEEWWLDRGERPLIQAKTKSGRPIIINYQANYEMENPFIDNMYITLKGSDGIIIDLKGGINMEFLDKTGFNMLPNEMNDNEKQKNMVQAITRLLNESIAIQLSQ